MIVTNPLALVLLIAIPYVIYVGWPRQRFRRVRDTLSLLLRCVVILLLVFGLAGAQIVESADKLAVVFLVDVSDSMLPAMQENAQETLREAVGAMGPDDEFGIVLFGANAVPERPVSTVRELESVRSTPLTSNTDIAEAIRLAMAMFPADAARRIVILSDGQPTVGDTQAAAELAAATGVEISYVAFEREPLPDVRVTRFDVPTTVSEGQQFDLNLTIESSEATPATVTIFARGEIVHAQEVNLREGANPLVLTLTSGTAGFKDFRVTVDPVRGDGYYQNNQLSAFSTVVGPSRVLLVSQTPEDIEHLRPALEGAGLIVDVATPNGLPVGIAALAQYESVILANVPATISNSRMETLERYVRDLGGGLVVVGGEDAYGPGGYFDTPLEAALPVEMQIKDQQRLPQLTIAYVIDRSGSMGAVGSSGFTNLQLAKEAMGRSIDFLQPTDRAAIVSFDTVGYWIAPFQPVFDRIALQRLIASFEAAGGTDILAGMQLTAAEIVNEPADRKHIILLTDGGASPLNLVELTKQLYDEHNVTTSVIAMGEGSAPFLHDMAEVGHGNYHAVADVESIPAIFTAETVFATRSYIVEEAFTPTLTANSPIMQGITSAPQLYGYVAVTPKLASQTILRGPEPFSDPILSSWQYGLGRAVAFTSDATAKWGADWVQWDGFSRFWSQAIRWTMTEGASNNLETRVEMENEQARLIVEARDDSGEFLNGLDLQVSLVDPTSSDSLLIPLQQVAPGRYEAVFTPSAEGAYFMRLTGSGTEGDTPLRVNQTTGWVMSYSPEYQAFNPRDGELLLADIAHLTGGHSMAETPGDAFLHNIRARSATAALWPWLLLAVVLLLPFDVAVRRLLVTRSDLQRLRAAVMGRQLALEGPSDRLAPLRDARERARRKTEQPSPTAGSGTLVNLLGRREQMRSDREAQPRPEISAAKREDQPRYQSPLPQVKSPSEEEEADINIAGRLLKRRKGEVDKE